MYSLFNVPVIPLSYLLTSLIFLLSLSFSLFLSSEGLFTFSIYNADEKVSVQGDKCDQWSILIYGSAIESTDSYGVLENKKLERGDHIGGIVYIYLYLQCGGIKIIIFFLFF